MNPQITVYKSDLKKRKEKEKKFYLARSENLVNWSTYLPYLPYFHHNQLNFFWERCLAIAVFHYHFNNMTVPNKSIKF